MSAVSSNSFHLLDKSSRDSNQNRFERIPPYEGNQRIEENKMKNQVKDCLSSNSSIYSNKSYKKYKKP